MFTSFSSTACAPALLFFLSFFLSWISSCVYVCNHLPDKNRKSKREKKNAESIRIDTSHLYVLFGVWRHTQKAMHREFWCVFFSPLNMIWVSWRNVISTWCGFYVNWNEEHGSLRWGDRVWVSERKRVFEMKSTRIN